MVAPVLRPTSGSNVSDLGQGGPVELSFNLFRATWDNQHFEDLAEHIEGEPQITADPSRDGTWILDADMTLDGWDQLDEYLDWLAPVVTARYPDGTIRKRQLGLYIVLDAAETRQEFTGTANLDARDPCWVLGAQAFTGKVKIDANANKIAIAKQLIDGAALSGANDC